jgi:hypothetical protein
MAQNKTKVGFNPLTGEFDIFNDLEMGWTVKNKTKASFKVKAGYTRMYPNLEIPDGKTVDIEAGGEIQVP